MCKSCVHGVQTLSKSRFAVHNLCAIMSTTPRHRVGKRYLSYYSTQHFTLAFSTDILSHLSLLCRPLSTPSTVPIIKTIN